MRPGLWPDVAAAGIPGMTVRHQLAVLRVIATETRINRAFPHAPADVAIWTGRVQTAYDAMDHGAALVIPAEARTLPPPPAPGVPKRRPAGKASSGAAKPSVAKDGKSRSAKKAPAKTRPARPPAKKSSSARRAGDKKR